MELLDGAVGSADDFLQDHELSKNRLEKVANVIEAFETPYGMELLSSVLWLSKHSDPPATGSDRAIEGMRNWNERKARVFHPDHIEIAWERLIEENWIPSSKAS